jgi:hypothetical protein
MLPISDENILHAYQNFVETTVKKYRKDYEAYCKGGGRESFGRRYWWMMMHEAVAEAEKIIMGFGDHPADKIQLLNVLKQIAEEALFSSPANDRAVTQHSLNKSLAK